MSEDNTTPWAAQVVTYNGFDDNVPNVISLEGDQLVEFLTDFPEPLCHVDTCVGRLCDAKFGSLSWSPVTLKAGTNRLGANVVSLRFAVFDLDHVNAETFARVRESVAPFEYALHTTHSHTATDGCYRLIFPLSRPITPAENLALRRAVVDAMALPADPACSDASRIYACPTQRGGVTPYAVHNRGEVLNVAEALELAGVCPAPTKEVIQPTKQVDGPIDLGALREGLAAMRRSKASSIDDYKKEQAALLGLVLDGKALAEPGFIHHARVKATGMVAWGLPANTPWAVALEVMRPCLSATKIADGETFEGTVEKTRAIYERSMLHRLDWEAKKAAEQALIMSLVKSVAHKSPQAAAEDLGDKWMDTLLLKGEGVRACEHNAGLLLACAPEIKGTVRWNDVAKKISISSGPFQSTHAESLAGDVAGWLQSQYAFLGGEAMVGSALLRIARANSWDPIAEYLNDVTWDGGSRLDTFLETYLGVEVTPENDKYVRAVSRRWLISLVARALRPGCKVDTIMIVEGEQGVRKSSALEALVGHEYFLDTSLTLGDKDMLQAISSAWLVELGELASFNRAESRKVKQFISSKIDKFRAPYAHTTEACPRRCVFVGTCNPEGAGTYLTDHTGNRRYLPVRAGQINLEAIVKDRDLLLAEAVVAFRAGERWWLVDEEVRQAAAETKARLEESTAEEAIARWWYGETPSKRPRRLSLLDMAEMAMKLTPDRVTHSLRTEIGIAAQELGFRHIQRSQGGSRARGYEPTPEMLEAPVVTSAARAAGLALVAQAKKGSAA